jgi:hypothetical protein
MSTRYLVIALLACLSGPVHAAQAAAPQGLSAANTSRYLGGDRWEWTIFITGPDQLLRSVRAVEYTLHPTFPNPVQTRPRGNDPAKPFAFTATGWGVFTVGIKVTFANGQTKSLRHMLSFVAPPTCSDHVTLDERRFQSIPDARFKNDVYVYVGDIVDRWKKAPTSVTLFMAESGSWGRSGRLSEADFAARVARNPRWTLRAVDGRESIEFDYGGARYVLAVTGLRTMPLPDRIRVQVCDKQTGY